MNIDRKKRNKEALYSVLCLVGLVFVVSTGWIDVFTLNPVIPLDWSIFLIFRRLGTIADILEFVPLITILALVILSVYFGYRAVRSFRSKPVVL